MLGKIVGFVIATFLFLLVAVGYFTIVIYKDDCDDTSWCPVGKIVEYDFVCGKKIRITEEYCRFFGGKLDNGKCDATYAMDNKERCEAAGGKFVNRAWFGGSCDFSEKCHLWQKVEGNTVFSDFHGRW